MPQAYIGKTVLINFREDLEDGDLSIISYPAIVTGVHPDGAILAAVFRDGGWGECHAFPSEGADQPGWTDVVTEAAPAPAPDYTNQNSVTVSGTGSASGSSSL
jgi:hypothetical protein